MSTETKKDLVILKRRDKYYIIGETVKGKNWLFQNVHEGYKGFVDIAEEYLVEYETMWVAAQITWEHCICHPKLDTK